MENIGQLLSSLENSLNSALRQVGLERKGYQSDAGITIRRRNYNREVDLVTFVIDRNMVPSQVYHCLKITKFKKALQDQSIAQDIEILDVGTRIYVNFWHPPIMAIFPDWDLEAGLLSLSVG